MIEIRNLRYRSLCIESLDIPPGIISVIGPNGSGKTTFLSLCAGIAEPEAGRIHIDGRTPRESGIGWVNEFPDKNILFPLAADEIASTLRFCYTPCGETARAVRQVAEFTGISHLLYRQMTTLSGGEKVLVALAAAQVHKPDVLVLDEYDSHLDLARCSRIEEVLRASKTRYILRCTQQMETAAAGDYLLYIEQGTVLFAGRPDEVFASLSQTPFYPFSWRCGI